MSTSLRTFDTFVSWPSMVGGIASVGGVPFVLDAELHEPGQVQELGLQGLILTGGLDVSPEFGGTDRRPGRETDPRRDAFESQLITACVEAGTPILGLCRGAQLLNVYFGGELYGDLRSELGTSVEHSPGEPRLQDVTHSVEVLQGSKLGGLSVEGRPIMVNSQHNQGIRVLSESLVGTAWSTDGLIEAFEHREHDIMGVQWHPEVMIDRDEAARQLFTDFVQRCNK